MDLTNSDIVDLKGATARILNFMRSANERGQPWVDASVIRQIAGGSEGLRRMRELRKNGYTIEKRKVASSRLFEYRLIEGQKAQQSLF